MTQEELDELMAGDLDEATEDSKESEEATKQDQEHYKVEASGNWPPPPPTEDHQVVNQLDDVTKDSEKKATEIFDKLEDITNMMADVEDNSGEVIAILDKNIETFEKLNQKFPNVETFIQSLEETKVAKQKLNTILETSQNGTDEVMMIMDIMQYQDIHRQKIERVINVMRALSTYMSSLFESNLDDDKRVGSAVHIAGDQDTDDLVDNDSIEALLESFAKK